MDLATLPGDLAVCRLAPDAELPEWAAGALLAIVRTAEELSIVCAADDVPESVRASGPWRAFRVAGTLDHGLTGVLSEIAVPLAAAEIPIFAISSFDTDYVLIPAERAGEAGAALAEAGHRFASR